MYYNIICRQIWRHIGLWLSLVERCVRDAEAVGSNPANPILKKTYRFSKKYIRTAVYPAVKSKAYPRQSYDGAEKNTCHWRGRQDVGGHDLACIAYPYRNYSIL